MRKDATPKMPTKKEEAQAEVMIKIVHFRKTSTSI
jgi:hypothetical protein